MKYAWLLFLVGCGYANAPSAWPARGPFVQVENLSESPLRVAAIDGMGRQLTLGTVLRQRKGCWRWPFIHARGLLVVGADTLRFQPWTKPGWRVNPWTGVLEPTAGFC